MKEKAISRLVLILGRHLYADRKVLEQIAERIFWEVVVVAVEDTRTEWMFNAEDTKRTADGGDH